MQTTFLSSGDLIADRRYDYAEALAEAGDAAGAADLYAQALEIAPHWVAAWFALGRARAEAGDRDGAAAAFARAAELDPEDRLGAALHAARLAGTSPAAPPAGYVRALFDGYAEDFDAALVGRLGYRAPAAIAAALAATAPGRRFAAALDLGCGTGLMAEAVRDRVDRIDGVDLSERMVARALAKGLYDDLAVGDVVEALAARAPGTLDLVLAADVFCYLGDLHPVLAAAARAMAPGGLLAFTVEWDEATGAPGYRLRDSLRYGHGREHVVAGAAAAGLVPVALDAVDLRRDRGETIRGLLAVLAR
ncbi:class I SAM-dependent DNA methyltransferase [Prosthecodimorpha staleyi]|uniref:Methyltransferase domain-containing protein n=1 Tax=Prosthecodimorpha staleyi TaxID=2840188 RepID=A0A947GJP1_9HYPH|nr:methyltransferase domain-containing protein [Prosthecodimorpha staleyi]MBT9292039.1 methyltransferase domain-containing protein [Prosthecodimorpha staleyi]